MDCVLFFGELVYLKSKHRPLSLTPLLGIRRNTPFSQSLQGVEKQNKDREGEDVKVLVGTLNSKESVFVFLILPTDQEVGRQRGRRRRKIKKVSLGPPSC